MITNARHTEIHITCTLVLTCVYYQYSILKACEQWHYELTCEGIKAINVIIYMHIIGKSLESSLLVSTHRLDLYMTIIVKLISLYSITAAGSDFMSASGTLTLTDLAPRPCVDISIMSDSVVESDEFFSLLIFDQNNNPDLLESPNNAVITITDSTSGTPTGELLYLVDVC